MDLTCQYFQSNLDIVFFIYGLAFVVMGLVIFVQPKKESGFKLAGILWLLAGFGVLHGINEWLDMWAILRGRNQTLDIFRWFILVISYFFLFEFGRRLFRMTGPECPVWRKKIASPFVWWLTPAIGVLIIISGFMTNDFWKTGSILTRYFLGFPGGLLIGFGFYSYYRCEKEILQSIKVRKYFIGAALTFLIYGILGGLVVPEGTFFPSNWLNNNSFCLTVKIPVQVFRALCAIFSAWAVSGIITIFNDERKREIYNALATREKITENIQDGISLVDKNFKVIWANKKVRETYGELIGDFCYHATHKRNSVCQPPNDPCPIVEVMKTGKPVTVLHTHFDKSDEPIYVAVSAYPVRDEQGKIVEFVHLSQDVTEKMKLEEIIKSIGDPLIVINPKGRITAVNQLAMELTGYDEKELLNKSAGIIFAEEEEEEEEEELLQHLGLGILAKNGSVHNYDTEIFTKIRTVKIPVSVNASLVKYQNRLLGIVCVLRDMREIKQLQSQFLQAEKMSAVGRLAGGIAHDFNNLLTAIKGNAELAMAEVDESGTLYNDLKEINNASSRAAALTRQLLLFSRKQPMEFTLLNINTIISNITKMLERLIGEDIKINLELETDIRAINADVGNLEQVLTNLVVNARDAMPQGGKIKIKTENIIFTEEECKSIIESYPGKFIRISIEDTGPGMDQEIIEHIFEPFFSTKGIGKGTGLGLAVVHGIIKQHKGWINVYSELGHGSIFNIYLPAINTKVEEKNNGTILSDSSRGNGERILFIEDEKSICSIVKRVLEKNNYNMFIAENVKDALALFEKEKGNFQLVLSDMILPDGTGLELVNQLLLKNPELHIIICSGYLDDKSNYAVIRERGYKFIQKPFEIKNLLETVREVLNNKK